MVSSKSIISNKFTANNRVQLIRSGASYFNLLLQLINNAQESIHLQTYIFNNDDTGKQVAYALKAAVKRKVEVHLMVDGYASQSLPNYFVDELTTAGIQFRFFEPIFKSDNFYFGRRLHQKVTVIDTKYALVGGLNIADRYNDMPQEPAWLDFAVYVEGEIAQQLCVHCWKTWKGYKRNRRITPCEEKEIHFEIPLTQQTEIRVRRNDWVRGKNEISTTYFEMLRGSASEVTILCSYFLPGKKIRNLMVQAIKRGVTIRVIAAGKSDIMLSKYAERWLYDWLLRKGIELYEYKTTILHGKVAVCDDKWMTIGSYNINNISAYASIELNLDVRNATFTKEVRQTLEEIITNDCEHITTAYHLETKNIFKQLTRWFSYQLFRTVFYLFTFYFKRHG